MPGGLNLSIAWGGSVHAPPSIGIVLKFMFLAQFFNAIKADNFDNFNTLGARKG